MGGRGRGGRRGAATEGVKGGYWYFNQIRFFAPLRPVMRTGSSGLSFGTW